MSELKKSTVGQSLKKLESIVEELSADNIDLEESVKKYEEGLRLAGEIQKQLKQVENKVEKIKKQYTQGDV